MWVGTAAAEAFSLSTTKKEEERKKKMNEGIVPTIDGGIPLVLAHCAIIRITILRLKNILKIPESEII